MLVSLTATKKLRLLFIAAIAAFVIASNCSAATGPGTSVSDEQVSDTQNTSDHISQTDLAGEWGLTPQEWNRYQTLMQGPRGIYSPGLDPLTALGIEAKTVEDRRRYAQLQVKAERERVDKELAYQRAYDQAFASLYPSEKLIQITSSSLGLASRPPPLLKAKGRLAIFVKDNCPQCIARAKDLQATKQAFDLYFVGSQGEDEKIRRWALRSGIEPARVRDRHITLNHDEGRWANLGLSGDLPAVVREVNGQWQRQ